MNLRIGYSLRQITYDNRFWVKDAVKNLRLELKLNGALITNHTEYLNEARLSALAICLYLSSVRENPVNFDFKVLFLDDVFIGLDASNRYPILNILKNEFTEYQIFITTYDRNWYELAQRFFNANMADKWVFSNLYVGKGTNGQVSFDRPLLIQNTDAYSDAVYYLHHSTRPDYPAAANYFRKYAEELLSQFLPPHEIRNIEDDTLIESYKLGKLVKVALNFFDKIRTDNRLLIELENSLPTLLHPLSHFDLNSPVYKAELMAVESLLAKLKISLTLARNSSRVFIPKGRMFKVSFTINASDNGHYEIYSTETIYLLRDGNGAITLSKGQCVCKTCYQISNGIETERRNFNSNDLRVRYESIEAAYNTIYNFIILDARFSHINRAPNYSTEVIFNHEGAWQTINTLMVW